MKRIKTLCFCLFLIVPTVALASYSTFELVADTQIHTKGGSLCALVVVTSGAADATVILYDVAAVGDIAVTNKLIEITVAAADNYGGRQWVIPVRFSKGLYADVTGAGASYFVEWER